MAIKILIYEDNKNLRESLVNLLTITGEFIIEGAWPDCREVTEQVEAFNPNVVLMDIDMPGINGIEAVKRIRHVDKKVQVIMLTVFDDNSHVFDALSAGANGYLLKKYITEKLVHAIHEVLDGGAPMSPSIARMIISNMHQLQSPDVKYQLTSREKEILTSLSKGNSFKMIASDLSISIDTVRTHIKHIYDKLHVHTQVEAVTKAINEKIV
jgi:DNA-binding NarL/FixJ family response regulator